MKPFVFASSLAFVSLACGASAPEPQRPATTATSTMAQAAASGGVCTATLTETKQPGWSRVGVLTMAAEGNGLRTEVRDASGKVVPTENAPASKEGEITPWIVASTCKLGGVFAFVDPKAVKPTDTSMTFELYKPAKEDEPGDLGALCTKPSMERAGPGLDPSQEARIAAAHYQETLTSPKWRAWFFEMTQQMAKSGSEKDVASLKKAKGEELAKTAKAAGKTSCWFASAVLLAE